MSTIPRLVISAPSSGHGKTAVSVGLLSALSARGYRAAGFKIGPDHVDAAYLGLAAGRPGRNLDPRMIGAKRVGPLFAHGAQSLDIAVVEGTMGLFDGLAGRTDSESTAQISGLLRAPVVLVVDVGAMGQSVAALVHGFRAYDELLWLGGVILNRVASSRHEQLLREALDDIGVPVLGALRRHALTDIGDAGAPLPSRHHGVAPVVHHNLDAVRAVRRLGEVIAGAVDIDRVMALARSAPRLTTDPWNAAEEVAAARVAEPAVPRIGRRPIIGVAFAYPETAELLTAAGAEVVPFDPLRDEALPAGVDGLVVGGALPESYAEELGFNTRLRAAVAAHAAAGKPIAAEGTGLVWLCRDFNGRPMCGVVDASARETDLVVLGYREATARSSSVLLPVGTQVVGHKMHRTTISPRAGLQAAWTWAGGPAEGFVHRGVHASYLGLHWAGTPSIASRFVASAGATATPVHGQWTTPSAHPYGRPSVVPAAQSPSSGTTVQFPAAPVSGTAGVPAAADTGDARIGLTKPDPARTPAPPGASPVSAPAGFAPAGLSTPGLSTPGLSTPGLSTPGLSTPGLGTPPAASPVSVPGPVSAPAGYAAPPTTYSPPAPVVGPGALPVAGAEEPPTAAIATQEPQRPQPPAVAGGAQDERHEDGDGIASSPFGPTSRVAVALASASQTAGAETAVAGGAGADTAAAEASVGVSSPANAPATASGLPSSGVVPTTVSAPPMSVSTLSTGTAPGDAAEGAGTVAASSPVSGPGVAGAGAVAVDAVIATGPAGAAEAAGSVGASGPVSTPPSSAGSGHQWPADPATSAAVPVSPAPMPTVAAPVSAAPGGMTAIPAGERLEEAPTAYLQLPVQESDPVSAPPATTQAPPATPQAPQVTTQAPQATTQVPQAVAQRPATEVGEGDGPPTSGPPAGGATEAA
ncbi:cobyrinate a,c-diamide synthase [Dactylosporangium sp. NPDC049742]|uniref:cobyrinate a,c-diamide synthase n=1 Tax=Dactylosporangium sp. NPDC049742 TaxID=3154737 RepID=UPI00341C65EE